MKTTVDLPDGLAAEAKARALEQRTTLRELIVSALRAELDRRNVVGPVDFHFPTTGGRGLGAGIDPSEAIELSYGLPS